MTAFQLASKIDTLPLPLKKEAEEYIESLLLKANINNEQIKKTPVFGCAKGHFKMSDVFDEPLEFVESRRLKELGNFYNQHSDLKK